jgi:DNA-binding transcriptional ArsR family regulator
MQSALATLHSDSAAAALLDPVRREILALLREPASAVAVAGRLGLPRQRVGYHIRALEGAGLLHHVGDRKKGNCTERLLQTTARHYLISPQLLGNLGADPAQVADKASSAYQVAVATEVAHAVATMRAAAETAGKKLPTLTLQVDVRFTSATEQQGFTEELTSAIADLVQKYHAPEGRTFRFTVLGHPAAGEKGKGKGEHVALA